MGSIVDTVIAANIILDLMDRMNKYGAKITIESLIDQISIREAEKKDLNKQLGIE